MWGEGKKDRKSYENCADYCGSICLVLIVFIFLITNIIIFSILCSKYNTDDTENFLSFLQCKNINKEAFEKYLVLNDLSSHISLLKAFQSIFIVLDFIFLIMSLILKCCFFVSESFFHMAPNSLAVSFFSSPFFLSSSRCFEQNKK